MKEKIISEMVWAFNVLVVVLALIVGLGPGSLLEKLVGLVFASFMLWIAVKRV